MEPKKFYPDKFGVIHFSGIGGIGMSGIAEILYNLGCKIQGSDLTKNANVDRLEKLGIKVFIGQKEQNIDKISVLVRSSAVSDENPEVVAARKKNIPVIDRADMLKEIMFLKNCITIAGTHGKTTTTSIIAHIFENLGFAPTVINGGILNSCNTNAYLGKGDWLVAEADESDGSFNKLPAHIAVVTNIDPEHMEFYGNFTTLRAAFKAFIEKVPFYGFAVLCSDHMELKNLSTEIKDRKIITYGEGEEALVRAVNIKPKVNGLAFDLEVKLANYAGTYKNFFVPMFGKYNVANSLAAIAVALGLGAKIDDIQKSLAGFLGVKRRLTITGIVKNNITIIDDYGHHPTEIKASLGAVKEMNDIKAKRGKVIAVMQPHRYSRLYDLFNEFSHCLIEADKIFVTDVYAAGEQEISGINKMALIKAIQNNGHKNVYAVDDLNYVEILLKEHLSENDTVIFMGAGDITKYANSLPAKLENIL